MAIIISFFMIAFYYNHVSTCSQCGRLVTRPETKYCSDECEEKAN